MKDIFLNYESFYNMLLSTTIMSNSKTPEYDSDMNVILDFVGKAYKLDEKIIEKCKQLILEDLSSLSLTNDQLAVYSARTYGDTYSDNDVLFDIKGDVLIKLESLSDTRNTDVNKGWFDYSHYKTYQPNVRAAKLDITSSSGNLLATRQMGILLSVGIGVEKNLDEAIIRLKQCTYWGDISAAYFLAYAYELSGDKKQSDLYYELATLEKKYLNKGITMIPENGEHYSQTAIELYAIISSIKQDIVYAYNLQGIDFSFVEAITLPGLSKEKRMYFIDNYEKKEWKTLTNASAVHTRVGF